MCRCFITRRWDDAFILVDRAAAGKLRSAVNVSLAPGMVTDDAVFEGRRERRRGIAGDLHVSLVSPTCCSVALPLAPAAKARRSAVIIARLPIASRRGTKTRARGGQESQTEPLTGSIWSYQGMLPSPTSIHGRSLPRRHGLGQRRIASINVMQQSKSPNCDFQRGWYRSPVSCLFLTSRSTLVWSGFPVSPALANAGTERDRQAGSPSSTRYVALFPGVPWSV